MEYTEILIAILFFVFFCYFYHDKNGLPTNWPFLGMFPSLLQNIHRFHPFFIEMLENANLTFVFKGPWFTNMQILATLDPANVHHIMTENFANYPKGDKFREIFDVLGDGIFNADFSVWEYHRKMIQTFLRHPNFHQFLVKKTRGKVENGLIPVLDHASKHGIEVDLQDFFARFLFDAGCTIMMDHDPRSLTVDFPYNPASDALNDIAEVIFYRHVVPSCVWKLQRWLGVGEEKKYKKAWEILDCFIYKCIDKKKEDMSCKKENNKVNTDLLSLYMNEKKGDKFVRDTILTNFLAGRDSTAVSLAWLFYLLTQNPRVTSKVKKELDNAMPINWENFKEINSKLVYLHATICETLRLYAPLAFEAKNPIEPDVLPSGHRVNPNMQIIFNLHAMGRMKSIWGEDCNEFKPERWISERGNIKHEPSYKFFVFNAGPRTCLGKDMAFTQMKIVAAAIIQNYVIEPVEEHNVVPHLSIFLSMKYGFKVRIRSRESSL